MSNILLIIGGLALVIVAYYSYRRRKSQPIGIPNVSTKEELVEKQAATLIAEKVDKLAMADVVNYFKSLTLKKGTHIPFIGTIQKNGNKSYLLAIINEETNKIEMGKLIAPDSIDDELLKVVGNETFVVLS